MSNAENNSRPEEGPEQSPERARSAPQAGADPEPDRAEPAARPETAPTDGGAAAPAEPHRPEHAPPDQAPQPGAAQSEHTPQPGQAPQPGRTPQPGSARSEHTPGSLPRPGAAQQPGYAQQPGPAQPEHPAHQTRVLHPSQHAAAPHMAAPGEAPPAWGAPTGPPPGYAPHGRPGGPPSRGRGKLVAGALLLALVAGGAGGAAGWLLADNNGSTTVVESVSMDAGAGMTYTEIVDKVTPSVVTIVTDAAEGSGVVYSDEGYIVTNNHVVEGASALEVRFSDGTVAEAQVVATDPTQDMAVVQVSGVDGIEPIAFGDSDSLQVGDATVAIGSPLGLEGTVTTGIVSALNRSMSVGSEGTGQSAGHTLSGLIQTDAAINMGNSGGALVNGSGELIGINTAILSPESGNVGLGFAIPSNTVSQVVEQLIEHGSVERGYLGVSVTDTQGNGAMVLAVEAGSPADEAGLLEGDVITQIDGSRVTSASEVVAAVQSKASGDQIAITYTRDGEEHTAEATLTSS
ncbi:MAG TPA: trypsin-like peptidase domain-containing protein [Glycomyces sp.]|nr:trypsin-like peptidase domain-containing protein [Glycomyces sp.]